MRQKLIEIQGDIDESIITAEDFNTFLSEMYRSIRQKINKYIVELNRTIIECIQLISTEYFIQQQHNTYS